MKKYVKDLYLKFFAQDFFVKKLEVVGLILLLLLLFCGNSRATEARISELQKEISALERQKAELEAEKQALTDEGDKLSYKIEELKIQSSSGLGIFGKYKLTRSLRKAQALSDEIQNLERVVSDLEENIKLKKRELEGEYEKQIAILLAKLDASTQAGERKEILAKVSEYQLAKTQLSEFKQEQFEHLDMSTIEIEEYDGPREIREKADLITDSASKMNGGIESLDARIKKLKNQLKTTQKLNEFAEEISFFERRVSREEVVSSSEKGQDDEPIVTTDNTPDAVLGQDNKPPEVGVVTIDRGDADKVLPVESASTEQPVSITATGASEPSSKIVLERNGVYAFPAGTSLEEQIEKTIELMEKQKEALEKQAKLLSEKARSFYQKADEIEKSETKKRAEKR